MTIRSSSNSNSTLIATELPNSHPFIERIVSKDSYEETTCWPRKLNCPPILKNISRRSWIKRSGKDFISTFYLNHQQSGYRNLIHGGVLAALIDDISAEFCNCLSPSLCGLTASLTTEFKKPSPPGAFFIAKLSTSREIPVDIEASRKVWIDCEILAGENKFVEVVKARALFVLREVLPKSLVSEAEHTIEDLL